MAARLRLCTSSPICSAWAMTLRRSSGPCAASASRSSGRQHLLHPAQAREHLVVVGAVAQHLAQPLVERGVGAVAEGRVLEDPHRHRGGDHAGHRPHGGVVVAGRERDLARGGEPRGLLGRLRQPLVDQPAHHRAARRAAHALPLDRRAGVQHEVLAHAGDGVERRADADDGRPGRQQPLDRLAASPRRCRRAPRRPGPGRRRARRAPRDRRPRAGASPRPPRGRPRGAGPPRTRRGRR